MSKNFYTNLESQLSRIERHCNQGSILTREKYATCVRQYCHYVSDEFRLQKFINTDIKHVRGWVEQMQSRGCSASQIKTSLSALRFYLDQGGSRRPLPRNDQLGLKLEKRQFGGVDRHWPTEAYEKALALAESMGRPDVRDALILARNLGLRIHETCRIDRATADKALKEGVLHIKGKGGLWRDIPMNAQARTVLQERANATPRGEKIFRPYGQQTHLVIKSIQNWVQHNRPHFSSAPLSYHGLRHAYAQEQYSNLISSGMAPKEARNYVSVLLGHHRGDVTKIYLHTEK